MPALPAHATALVASAIVSVVLTLAPTAVSRAGDAVGAPQSEAPRPQTMAEMLALPADNVRDALDSELRSTADRARDAAEKPEPLLRASGVQRGMRVAELHAGDGYFAQILALAVRRFGKVWANDDPALLDEETAAAWRTRLESPPAADIARLQEPLSAPIPVYVSRLDIVFSRDAYHRAVERGFDRQAMNALVLERLKPGGAYVVVDTRAADGEADADAARNCRVSESLVRREVEAAGFRFVSSSDALRAPGAASAGCNREPGDRFLLVFRKPE